jgi:hypothetical protein
MKAIQRLLREPLLHFLAIGAALFLVYGLFETEGETAPNVIVVTPERVTQLEAGFASVWKRPPSAAEREKLIEDYIKEEIYYREALALGLDRNDAVVRRRLRQKMEFLTDVGAELISPSDDELQAYLENHSESFRQTAKLAFDQIYLGEAPSEDAAADLLAELESANPPDPAELGERTLLPPGLGLSSPFAVDGTFGGGFFDQLTALPLGTWSGPVASAYGVHLVRVTEVEQSRLPPLAEIRDIVAQAWQAAKAEELRDLHYARLRERFTLEIQEAPQ